MILAIGGTNTRDGLGGMVRTHPSAFGSLLRRHRTAAGLTQEELAERARLSARAVSDLERGVRRTPYRDTVQQLADALELTVEERAAFDAARRSSETSPPPALSPACGPPLVNLPDEPTSFIGRQEEIAAVISLLRRPGFRLVTLTGPGGIGKTRLALQVAERLRDGFRDGVCFVSLATIGDPSLVPAAIARALGSEEPAGETVLHALTALLATKHLLLVLDNFEHLPAAHRVVTDLLNESRELTILATSRSVLHLSREHEYTVPPLSLPGQDGRTQLPLRSDAVALFTERARKSKPNFSLTAENQETVAEICRRLDGLPLAIELAAARVRLFPPAALLKLLTRRLRILTGGPHDSATRHQGLREAIDWSYSLLDQEEKRIFAYIAVFAGGCTLEAAETVCGIEGEPETDVLAGATSLVEQSLLSQVGEEEPRFVMLETIREYAEERLEQTGTRDELKRRHASYYLCLAEEVSWARSGREQPVSLGRLTIERDNLHAALHWTAENDVELGLRLVVALGYFWMLRGPLSDGRYWLDRFLAATERTEREGIPALRAAAMFVAGQIASCRAGSGEAEVLLGHCLALYRQLGDTHGSAQTGASLALELLRGGGLMRSERLERAGELLEEAIDLARESGDPALLSLTLRLLSGVATAQGEVGRARSLRDASATAYREFETSWQAAGVDRDRAGVSSLRRRVPGVLVMADKPVHVSQGWYWAEYTIDLAMAARNWGDYEQATQLLEEGLTRALEIGDTRHAAYVRYFLGLAVRDQGNLDRASALFADSLAAFQEVEDVFGIAMATLGLSDVARDRGDAEQTTSLAEQSLGAFREVGDAVFTAFSLHNLAHAARFQGNFARADDLLDESLTLLKGLAGGPAAGPIAEVVTTTGLVALERQDFQSAERAFRESLVLVRQAGVRYIVGTLLEGIAAVAAGMGRAERSVRLSSAAHAARSALGTPIWPAYRSRHDAAVTTLRSTLGQEEFARVWDTGGVMSIEEALAFALQENSTQ